MGMRVTPNSEKIPLDVVGSSTFGDFPKISLSKTYNMFISPSEDGKQDWLIPYPGWHKAVVPLENGNQGRGLFRSFRGNRMIAVVDSNVYDIDGTLTPRLVGQLQTSAGEVFMDENLQQQIAIVDGLNLYIYNYSLFTLTIQTGGPLGTTLIPNYVAYHNTFFLIGNANTTGDGNKWYSFSPSVPTTVAVSTEMSLETKPDTALAIKRIPGQAANVLVFGGAVCEIHTQVGGLNPQTGFAQDYQRNSSISVDYGCASVSTIAESDTHIAWLGINEDNLPVIMVMTGQSVQRISTDGIDFLLQNLKAPTQSTAMMYRINGHLMYHLTFFNAADNLSLMYDFNTQKFFHLSNHDFNFHPARQLVYFNANANNTALDGIAQNIFFISINGGFIYQLSQQFYTVNEDINTDLAAGTDPNLTFEMQRVRICKPIRMETSSPFKINQLCFTIEMGVDNIPAVQDCIILMITEDDIRMFSEMPDYRQLVPEGAGQEDCIAIPYQGRIDLAISKDGAESFSNYVPRFMNPPGIRKNILRWNKMGRANDLTPKIQFHTYGRIVCTDGYVEASP